MITGNVGSKLYGTGGKGSEDLSLRNSENLKKVATNDLSDNELMDMVDNLSLLTEEGGRSNKYYENAYSAAKYQAAQLVELTKINNENLPRVGFGEGKLRYNPNEQTDGGGYTNWYIQIKNNNGRARLIRISAAQYGPNGNPEYTKKVNKILNYAE